MAESEAQIRKRLRLQRINKVSAAISQLETAIMLWINDGDISSIHALAVASSDCFNAIATKRGKPSRFQTWIRLQSKTFRKKATEVQNFLKHGWNDLTAEKGISPLYSEMLMFDSIVCHEVALGPMSPLMRTFATRFVIENREILDEKFMFLIEGLNVDYLAKLDRREAAAKLLQLFQLLAAHPA
jgi:hypothetical protein